MVECKSQASFTARRLVGQIRTMETTATSRPSQRIRGQTTTKTLVALPPTMISSKHLQRRQNNHTFSYTFSPNSSEQAAGNHDNDSSDEQYLEEIEFEVNSNGGGDESGCEDGSNCNVSIGGNRNEDGQLSVATCQDHGRRRQHRQQPSLGRHCSTEGQECCLANFGGQNKEKSRKSNERNINNNNNKIFSRDETDEQQQVEDFSSEDNQDLNSSSSSINNNNNKMWKITRKNKSKKLQAYQLGSKLSPISLKSAAKISSPSQQQQQHQNFVRCSGISVGFKTRSSIRRSKRGSKRAQKRQVRFEPKPPETINISATTFESDDNSFKTTTTKSQNREEEEEEEDSREENEYIDENPLKENNNKKMTTVGGGKEVVIKEPLVVRYSNNGEKKKIPQYLSAAKPFTRKLHHLSHNIKFNKIKLKSFNNLAHQLHQTLSNSTNNFVPDNRTNNSRKLNKQQQNSSHNNSQTTTAASSGRHSNSEQQTTNGVDDEDFGWGSDFDEQSADSSLTSQQQQNFKDHSGGSTEKQGGYLLEIGKSSCDFRAIEDVIQDQGTSGQFKRLDLSHHEMSCSFGRVESALSSSSSSSSQNSSLVVKGSDNQIIGQNCYVSTGNKVLDNEREGNDDNGEKAIKEKEEVDEEVEIEDEEEEEDDEAELKSLEARQGFKQIRDKLKVILDQRLANYEKSAIQTDNSDESVDNKKSKSLKVVSDDEKSVLRNENKQIMVKNEPNNQPANSNAALLVSTQTSSTCSPSKNSSSSLKIVTSSIPTSITSIHDDASSSPTSSATTTTTTNSSLVSPSTSASTNITSPSKSTTTTAATTTNATSTTTTSANNGCAEFEDCQSHCSDESSSSSVGLDSNHSSGQDSGHSTQHSGYSTSLSVMHRHHHHGHNAGHDCHDNHHQYDHHRHHRIVCDDGELVDERTVVDERSPIQSNGTLSVSPTCNTRNDERKSPTVSSTPPLSSSAYSSSSSPSHTIKDGETEMVGLSKQTQLNNSNSNNEKPNLLDSPDETSKERRNRFLQNRSIINNKLESMFRSRSNGALSSSPKQSSPKQSVDKQEETFTQKQQQPNKITMATALPDNANIDSETRIKLLEQQRQISLKLKQKPRRKSAKRAFLINNQCLDSNNVTPNTEEDNGSYSSNCNPSFNERFSVVTHHYNKNSNSNNNKLVIPNTCTGTIRHNNYESLTKQLSMICLRQAGSQLAVFQNSQKPLDKHHHLGTSSCATNGNWDERVTTGVAGGGLSSSSKYISTATTANFNTLNLRNHSNHHHHRLQQQQQQPKAAMSLRQLVKDVIDDCEKPNKLSSLTISILNRSDSLSSDLATLSADEAITPSEQQQTATLVATNLNDSDHNINGREIDEEEKEENISRNLPNPSFNDSMTNYQRNHHFYQRENHRYYHSNYVSPTSSLSLSSIPNASSTGMACLSIPVANQANTKGDMNRAIAVEPIGYMVHPIPLPTISMKSTNHHQHNHHSSNSDQHYNHNSHHHQQQQHHHQQQQVATAAAAADQSISSIGSIDGLEYSRATTSSGYSNSELCLQSTHNVGETAGVISNGQLTNTVIGFGKMQKSTIGSYLKSLRELSRFKKLPKVKLINGSGINSGSNNSNNKLSVNQHHQFDHGSDQAIATANSNTLFGSQTNPSTSTIGHHDNKFPPSSHYEFYNDVNFY